VVSEFCEAPHELVLLADRYESLISDRAVKQLAHELGVSVRSLRRLTVGWDGDAFTFPMRDATGTVVGIRRRFPNGRKLSVKGGREGLFIPRDLPAQGQLLICEGPTDCAAMLDLAFSAIGRPSCTGGTHLVISLARGRDVVAVADADPPGQRGASALATALSLYCPSVRVIRPPDSAKDARDWQRQGGTHEDILRAIDAARPIELVIKHQLATSPKSPSHQRRRVCLAESR